MNHADGRQAPGRRAGRAGRTLTRRSLVRSGLASLLAAPWATSLQAATAPGLGGHGRAAPGRSRAGRSPQDDEIVLGVSAAFSGPSRGLGTELYRGSMAYFNQLNEAGGVNGRRIVMKLLDDGYQPDPCVANTIELMRDERVFLLFNYVGTPTVTRALPVLKTFSDQQVFLFFPFTGAEPQREPPYGEFAFNLRASYRQETAGLVDNFLGIGRRRIAVFYQNDAYGRSGWAGVREALARHGETIVGEATYTRGTQFTASMREQVEILQQASPDAVVCIGSYAACGAFARDSVDLGLHVPVANVSFVGSENMLQLLQEGRADPGSHTRFLVNSQVVPSYEDASLPAVREYLKRDGTPRAAAALARRCGQDHRGRALRALPAELREPGRIRQRKADHRDHPPAWATIRSGPESKRRCSPCATTTSAWARGSRSGPSAARACSACTTRSSRGTASCPWRTGRPSSPDMSRIRVHKLFRETRFFFFALFGLIVISVSILSIRTVSRELSTEYESNSRSIAQNIADSSVDILLNRNLATLQSLIDQFVQIESIRYIYITSETGEFLAHTFVPGIPDEILGKRRVVDRDRGAKPARSGRLRRGRRPHPLGSGRNRARGHGPGASRPQDPKGGRRADGPLRHHLCDWQSADLLVVNLASKPLADLLAFAVRMAGGESPTGDETRACARRRGGRAGPAFSCMWAGGRRGLTGIRSLARA